jgi:hypothetical protein
MTIAVAEKAYKAGIAATNEFGGDERRRTAEYLPEITSRVPHGLGLSASLSTLEVT